MTYVMADIPRTPAKPSDLTKPEIEYLRGLLKRSRRLPGGLTELVNVLDVDLDRIHDEPTLRTVGKCWQKLNRLNNRQVVALMTSIAKGGRRGSS